jgi:predicted CoA-binding protein
MLARDEIRTLLRSARTIAVVGLSDDPNRSSYGIAGYLQRHGYTIFAVNPNLRGPVLGCEPYASLRYLPGPVDVVDVFRRPEFVPAVVEDALAIGAKALWLQSGIVHKAAAARAEAAGMQVVMDQCIAVQHRLLL